LVSISGMALSEVEEVDSDEARERREEISGIKSRIPNGSYDGIVLELLSVEICHSSAAVFRDARSNAHM
jgi:hypothetical protein